MDKSPQRLLSFNLSAAALGASQPLFEFSSESRRSSSFAGVHCRQSRPTTLNPLRNGSKFPRAASHRDPRAAESFERYVQILNPTIIRLGRDRPECEAPAAGAGNVVTAHRRALIASLVPLRAALLIARSFVTRPNSITANLRRTRRDLSPQSDLLLA